RRIIDRPEGVRRVDQAATGDLLTVGAEGQVSDAAVVDLLPLIVRVELRGFEAAHLLARPGIPLYELALEVGRDEAGAGRVEADPVDRPLVPRQFEEP